MDAFLDKMESSNQSRIVILGGGFAGLRIAYLLTRRGYRVSLIEKNDALGGMVQTYTYEHQGERYRFDYGPHLFFEDHLRAYRDLLGADLMSLSGRFCMYARRAMLSYPLRPSKMLIQLNPVQSVLYLLNYMVNAALRTNQKDRDDLEAFMTGRFGRKLFLDFYSPYIEKCTGLAPNQISLLWAKERENVSGRSLKDNVINKIKASLSRKVRDRLARANSPSADCITAWYPRKGAGQLCDVMTATLDPAGLYLNSQIESIEIAGKCVRGVVCRGNNVSQKISGDYYVSTIPLPELVRWMPPDWKGRTEIGCLRYRKMRLVNLIVFRDRILDCLEVFSMDRRHLFKRVYEPKAMSDTMARSGKSSLCVEVCCNEGDEIEAMPAKDLVARCIGDLLSMKLLPSVEVVRDAFIVDVPNAYPIYQIGFESERQKLTDLVGGMNNLITCGRQGLFRYHAMTNEVMEMAERVTDFLDGSRDKRVVTENDSQWGAYFH